MSFGPKPSNGFLNGNHGKSSRINNRSLLEISQNLPSIHDDTRAHRSRSHDPGTIAEETHRKLKRRAEEEEQRSKSLGPPSRKRGYQQRNGLHADKENRTSPKIDENNHHIAAFSPIHRKSSDKHVRFDGNSAGSPLDSPGHGRNGLLESLGDPSPTDSRKRKPNLNNHKVRVAMARDRAKLWAETYSDPGPEPKAIHNDNVIRGRHLDAKRGRLITDPARSKHSEYINQSTNERPKAAEKGRRLQSLPSRKEQSDAGERPVNSAPSKEQPKMNGPMPKVNSLVTSTSKESPEVKEQPKMSESQATKKEAEKVPVKKVEPKPSEQRTETQPRTKPDVKPPDHAGTSTQAEDNKRGSKFTTPSPAVKSIAPKPAKTTNLPPDDHGAINTPVSVSPQKEPGSSKEKEDEDFKYYASVGRRSEPQEIKVPPLQLHSEKSSSKTDKSAVKSTGEKQRYVNESPRKSDRSKTLDISRTPTTDFSDKSKKRREVTIVDTREIRKKADEEAAENGNTFPQEYEYRDWIERRPKDFDEMNDEEKFYYYKNEMKLRPEQIRELTFHPKVNESKVIHHTYTGIDTKGWESSPRSPRAKSGKGPKLRVYKKVQSVLPHQRKSFMLSRLQGIVYRHINKVYGASPRSGREKQFFQKLAKVQIDEYERRYQMLEEKERKRLESTFRQREQLKNVRRKFEDDAWRRFMTQYVTSKVVEAEYKDRKEYGLPNEVNAPRPNYSKRRKAYTLTPKRRNRANYKKYSNMFNYNTGPQWKTGGKPLKFEGYDSVYINTNDGREIEDFDDMLIGGQTRKKQNVRQLMKEARKLLEQSDNEYTDDDDDDVPIKPKSDDRRQIERPRHHRNRANSQSTQQTKSTRKAQPPPKTMKELIGRRNAPAYGAQNRYKASGFNDIKADLLKGSKELNKREEARKQKMSEQNKTTEEEAKPKEKDTSPERPKPSQYIRDMRTPPDSPRKSPTQTSTVTKTVVTKHITTVNGGVTENERANWKIKDGNIYLDNTETQIGIDLAKEKSDLSTEKNKDAERESVTSKTAKPSQNGSGKTDIKPPERAPSRSSVQTNQTQQSKVQPQYSRAPSRASIISFRRQEGQKTDQPDKTKLIQQRRMSKTSLQVQSGPSNSKTFTPVPSVYNSRVSLRDSSLNRNSNNKDTNGRLSRASIKPDNINSSRVSLMNKKTVSSKENSDRDDTSTTNLNKDDDDEKMNKDNSDTETNKNMKENGDTQPKQSSASSNKPHTSNQEKQTTTVTKTVKTETIVTNGDIRRNSKQSEQSTSKPNKISETKTETKHVNGHGNGDVGHSSVDRRNSQQQPIIKKTVNVTEKEDEHVKTTTHVKHNSTKPRKTSRHENDDILSSSQTSSKQTTNEQRAKPPASDKSKPKAKQSPRDAKTKSRRSRSRSRTPTRKASNQATDFRMSRDDYENKGQRSASRGRRRSKSKERKRSLSGDRKKGKQKSRFPVIQKRDGRMSVGLQDQGSVDRKVSVHEDEQVTELEVDKKATGAKQWKDLVSKYLRQPSPKVGKTEDRSVLETNLETDDDDDEVDIFERAKKRYLLDVDDDSDDD